MPARWLALVLVLGLLPTVELVEQGVHVVEHVVAGEAPVHDAHHGDAPADEHGCTGLVHLCGAPHGAGLTPVPSSPFASARESAALRPGAPGALHDLAARQPAHRPPIA